MLIPLSWIQEFVDVRETPEAIADAFNQLGIEVEGIQTPGAGIEGVRVARILAVNPHPEADKVRLADIDFGDGLTTVVCGAPKLNPGMVIPYASVGVTLPNGLTLTPRKIRGIVSDGMLCSPDELGLGNGVFGLLELSPDLPLGSDVGEALGRGETVFDLSITPNRPDAMCVIGLARELAAHFKLPLKPATPPAFPRTGKQDAPSVDVKDSGRAPRYLGWRASVEVGPSPDWLAKRLTMAGLRPVNNVVDVTNYVMLERNQPLHAFDYDRVRGIVVRNANEGEVIRTLDSKDRKLVADDLLICDVDGQPQAIAGVMGGEHSEITDTTTEILLEAAYFSSHGISLTSRRLGLRTDASSRFDRGIDPNAVGDAAARAMELLVQVANAQVAPESTDVIGETFEPLRVAVRTARINALLGLSLTATEVSELLQPLGFGTEGKGDDFDVVVPRFRPDVTREIDLVEEVARRVGYQNIPVTMRTHSFHRGALTPAQAQKRLLADVLVGAGFNEAKCFPLVAPHDLDVFGVAKEDQTVVANPLRDEESILATTLLPGLLKSVAFNVKQGNKTIALFEMDRVFRPSDEQWLNEQVPLAAVVSGAIDARPIGTEQALDVFTLAGAISDVVDTLRLADVVLVPAAIDGFEPQSSHQIVIDGVPNGVVGTLSAEALKTFDVTQPVAAFEISTEALAAASRRSEKAKVASSQPPSYFDLAFLVDAEVQAAALTQTVRDAGGELVEAVKVFDSYSGERVAEGMKSIALAVTVRAPDRTLTDKDMHVVRDAAIASVSAQHGATLRGA